MRWSEMNNLINLILALYPIFINKITNKMKSKRANDSNFILRSLFIHCYIHIYQIITTADPSTNINMQLMYFVHPGSNYLIKSSTSSPKGLINCSKIFWWPTSGILCEEQLWLVFLCFSICSCRNYYECLCILCMAITQRRIKLKRPRFLFEI